MTLSVTGGIAVVVALMAVTPSANAIVGGDSVVEDGISPQPAIVKLFGGKRGALDKTDVCTGTLISPTWVLTAQHCTNKADVQGDPWAPAEMAVAFRRGAGNPAYERTPVEIIRMPNYLQGVEEAARLAGLAVGVRVVESEAPDDVRHAVEYVTDPTAGRIVVVAFDPAGAGVLRALPADVPMVAATEAGGLPAPPPA